MQWLSIINATDEPVFPVPVCRFWSNGKKQSITQIKSRHYPIWVIYPRFWNQWYNVYCIYLWSVVHWFV